MIEKPETLEQHGGVSLTPPQGTVPKVASNYRVMKKNIRVRVIVHGFFTCLKG
jgi:hypothetical protein